MTDRIHKLRSQSLTAVNRLSAERALLVTEFYQTGIDREVSVPVMRAMTFEYILKHKHICINEGELIVGERGPEPKACPTYPEITVHSLQDLEILTPGRRSPSRLTRRPKRFTLRRSSPSGRAAATATGSCRT
jgi:hypothetical protein